MHESHGHNKVMDEHQQCKHANAHHVLGDVVASAFLSSAVILMLVAIAAMVIVIVLLAGITRPL